MAGASAERQESGVVNAIKDAVKKNKNNPITIVAGKTTITGVIDAEKYSGRQISGSEPYTDVQIFVYNKKDPINLSLKGESAPSLAGGGLRGLELAVPGIAKKFMKAAFEHLTKKVKLNPGDKVPDVFGKIGSAAKIKIVVGNVAMGGPIDYMYIGPMSVVAPYDAKNNVVKFNGELTDATEYAKSHDLYFRFRARREDQRFDPNAKDSDGTPKIYGKSPSRGDSAGRIVVTDKVSGKGELVNI
jgi:hypothetical protein